MGREEEERRIQEVKRQNVKSKLSAELTKEMAKLFRELVRMEWGEGSEVEIKIKSPLGMEEVI